ncbi:hypothetical protein P7G87_00320 [Enterococcus asini]|uniref:hypothetical protein n=1 Tax=Enterococcus asini TaxID=57732 RepID=UPI00288DF8AE|nr:hypothetical protein [Enterococcus asini]MDT2783131.1 hypothetical protein [Enterococcus asini]
MELFKHIMTAMLVGVLLAGAWLGVYALVVFIGWIANTLSFVWVMVVIVFIAGTVFYLVDNPDV